MADNFYYNTKTIKSKDILKSLINEITVLADEAYRWDLCYPESVDKVVDEVMLHTVVTDASDASAVKKLDRYLKIYRPQVTSLNSTEQTLLNKYNYQGNFSSYEIAYLQKYFSGQNFETTPIDEVTFLKNWYDGVKAHSTVLSDADMNFTNSTDQAIMNLIRYVQNFNDVQELFLYAKELNGKDALTADEQTNLNVYKSKRVLTPDDVAKANTIISKRGLTEDLAKLVILDSKGVASALTSSIGVKDGSGNAIPDTTLLANYRQSRIVTPEEMTQVTAILAKVNVNNCLMWQIGSEIDSTTKIDFIADKCSIPARLAWYRHVHTNLTDYTGLDYYITQNKTSINLVVVGDASADVYSYDNWLIGYAYVGTLLPLDSESLPDYDNNWCMTVSSEIKPTWNTNTTMEHYGVDSEKFGFDTANGVTDVAVMGTMSGIPYQAHDVGFYTNNPSRDEMNTQGSRWNKKRHQFSDLTVVHKYDMERGKMQNVLIGDASAKANGDRLMFNKKGQDAEMYIKFNITAPYNFLNNSPNPFYCIALRVKVDEFFKNNYCENCQYKEFSIEKGYTGGYNGTGSTTTP